MLRSGKKRKPAKKAASEIYRSNYAAYGDEPAYQPGEVLTKLKKWGSFNWYAYMATVEDAREYVTSYVKRTGMKVNFSEVSDRQVPMTAAWLCRIDELGAIIGPDSHKFIASAIDGAVKSTAKNTLENERFTKKTPKVEQVLDLFISNLEEVIDSETLGMKHPKSTPTRTPSNWNYNVYEALKLQNFPTSAASSISKHYERLTQELRLAVAGSNAQLNEGYSTYKKAELRAWLDWMEKLAADCEAYSKNTKKLRAPTKKKSAPSAEKKLKNFSYLKESLEYKIASVDPAKIIGAKEAYLFNVKYKTVTVLAGDSLDVKGKSIVGYDEARSYTKSAGRKAAEVAPLLGLGGKVSPKPALEKLTGQSRKASGRVDENTVILKLVT